MAKCKYLFFYFAWKGPYDDEARFIYGENYDDVVYERNIRILYKAKVSRIKKFRKNITESTKLTVGKLVTHTPPKPSADMTARK